MADRNPAFGTAAYRSTELLQQCTVDGLLSGGLHYKSHAITPCLHHTFAHAKSLAFVLDNAKILPEINTQTPLPRSKNYGIKHFSDLDVWLVSTGPWRATVSANDVVFKKPLSQAATGGSLAVLWHEKVGPLFTASMAEYLLVGKDWGQKMGVAAMVLPLISPNHEEVVQVSKKQIELHKEGGKVVVSSNAPITVIKTKKSRVFNMVPGMEAIPLQIDFEEGVDSIECSIKVV